MFLEAFGAYALRLALGRGLLKMHWGLKFEKWVATLDTPHYIRHIDVYSPAFKCILESHSILRNIRFINNFVFRKKGRGV